MTRPALHLIAELEEMPVVRLEADHLETENRLLVWLDSPAVQRSLIAALRDALDELREAA